MDILLLFPQVHRDLSGEKNAWISYTPFLLISFPFLFLVWLFGSKMRRGVGWFGACVNNTDEVCIHVYIYF